MSDETPRDPFLTQDTIMGRAFEHGLDLGDALAGIAAEGDMTKLLAALNALDAAEARLIVLTTLMLRPPRAGGDET